MSKKSKKEVPFKDTLTKALSLLGAFLAIPCVVPQVPWRKAAMDTNLGNRFTVARSISLFTITNHQQVAVTWMKMRKDMCHKVRVLSKPNVVGMIVGTLGQKLLGSGGSLAGCAGWQACKDHAVRRCAAYGTMAALGLVTLVLLLISSLAAVSTAVLLGQEETYKKSKDKEAARSTTMTCSIVAFVSNGLAVAAWVVTSDSTFKSLQQSAYYPYPANFIGSYLAGTSTFFLFLAMYCGITRVYPIGFSGKSTEQPEDQEAEEYAAMTGLPMEGMGMGGAMGDMPPPPMGAMGGPGMAMADPMGGAMGPPMGGSPPFMRT